MSYRPIRQNIVLSSKPVAHSLHSVLSVLRVTDIGVDKRALEELRDRLHETRKKREKVMSEKEEIEQREHDALLAHVIAEEAETARLTEEVDLMRNKTPGPSSQASNHSELVVASASDVFQQPSRMMARLSLLHTAKGNEPLGLASISACMASAWFLAYANGIIAVHNPTGYNELCAFLAAASIEDLNELKDPLRYLAVLVSPLAHTSFRGNHVNIHANAFLENLHAFGIEVLDLEPNIEDQVNKIVKEKNVVSTDLFKPGDLVPTGGEVPLLVLLSAEAIKVEWTNQFTAPGWGGEFTNIRGDEVDAYYVTDDDGRRDVGYATITDVHYVHTTNIAQIVEIPCKHDGRSMLLLLPTAVGLESLDMAIEGLAQHISDNSGLRLTSQSVDIIFPRFKGTVGPISIIPNLKTCGLEAIFNDAQTPFDATLSVPGMDPAVVGKVMHFASFAADENGAEAKAVTTSVITSRMSSEQEPPPIKFHCCRPFVAILGKKLHSSNGVSTWNFEFGMKITGSDSLDTSKR